MKSTYIKTILNFLASFNNLIIVNKKHYYSVLKFYNNGLVLKRHLSNNLPKKIESYILNNFELSYSQLFQDLLVRYISEEVSISTDNRFFVEFGAADGIYLSNTKLLEQEGWKGVVAEPAKKYREKILQNRNCIVVTKAVGVQNENRVTFVETEETSLSTRREFLDSDLHSKWRRSMIKDVYEVESISINNLLALIPNRITYLSIDIEGGEYRVLAKLDWENYHPKIISVEHNYSPLNKRIETLLNSKGYVRVFREFLKFDSMYVSSEIYKKLIATKSLI